MEKYRLQILDEGVAETLLERGYKLDDNSLLVDADELSDVLDILGEEEELDFEGDDE